MKKFLSFLKSNIIYILSILIWIFIYIHYYPIMTESRCKKYIIEHQDSLKIINSYNPDKSNIFYLLNIKDLNYYEEVTIKYNPKTANYFIIFWGNRKSWKFRVKLDKDFEVDIPYLKSKNKNVELDEKLINILNEKLK